MTSVGHFALFIALLASGCNLGEREEEEERAPRSRVDDRGRVVLDAAEREALGLETVAAAHGRLTTSVLRFGRGVARPAEDALVAAPVSGRLVAPTLALGAHVLPGDRLVTLEPIVDTASHATLEAQRRELQGQIDGARAQVEAKRSDLARVATLVSSGLATEAERAQAEAALTSEQARVESFGRASAELGRVTGGLMEIRAPVPGVVAALVTDSGTLIPQGAILARIVRSGPRWVDIAVPPGDPVGSGYRAQGVSSTVSAKLLTRGVVIQSDGTRRDRLEADPDAAADLPPGATVPVDVLHETEGTLVPADAVVRRGRETLVFVEAEAGRYEARPVEIAEQDDTRAVLLSGVSPGERVVARGASALLGELGKTAEGSR